METSLDSWSPSTLCKWQDSIAVDCILLVYLGQHGVVQLGKCGPQNFTVPMVVHVSLLSRAFYRSADIRFIWNLELSCISSPATS